MFSKLKQAWRRFHKAPPGERFQHRYREKQGLGGSRLLRTVWVVLGGALVTIGLFPLSRTDQRS